MEKKSLNRLEKKYFFQKGEYLQADCLESSINEQCL